MRRLLPVYPWPMHPQIAKELAKRTDIQPVEALPGGPGPVLAIRKAPTFVCDAIVVERPERLLAGVDVALRDGLKIVTVRDMVSEAMNQEHPLTEETQRKINKGPVFK